MTLIPIVIGALGTASKRFVKEAGIVRNRRTSRDHPNYSIINIGQITEKRDGNLRRLAVTQTPMKDDQLTLG